VPTARSTSGRVSGATTDATVEIRLARPLTVAAAPGTVRRQVTR
jgi:hypothetical protein